MKKVKGLKKKTDNSLVIARETVGGGKWKRAKRE